MSKLVVILGATGKQGRSVVEAFLDDASFRVRALTRDASSSTASGLRGKGVKIVEGDVTDFASLQKAFTGAHYIYAMTPDIGVNGLSIMARGTTKPVVEEAYRVEREAGMNIIRAASATVDTLNLFIFSGLSAEKELSNHQYEKIYHFDSKANLVQLIENEYRKLAEKTVVLQLGMFATNWTMPTPLKPTKQPDGRFRILMPCSASTPIPFIDPATDPAIFVKALTSQELPPQTPTQRIRQFAGYAKMTTFDEWTRLLNDNLPLEVFYEQASLEQWASEVSAVPGLGIELAEMWNYCEKVGYFGGERGNTIKITELQLGGTPTNMEDFVKKEDWSTLYD